MTNFWGTVGTMKMIENLSPRFSNGDLGNTPPSGPLEPRKGSQALQGPVFASNGAGKEDHLRWAIQRPLRLRGAVFPDAPSGGSNPRAPHR